MMAGKKAKLLCRPGLNCFKECIWSFGIEDLIAGHNGNKILGIREINNIMRPSRDHTHCLDLVSADLEFNGLSGINITLANKPVSGDNNKQLPL